MLAYYPKVIDILKRCTTDQISQAEEEMKNLAFDDLDVLSCLQSCLKDPTLDQALKTIATSHINSLFVTNITEYTQDFILIYFKQLLRDPCIKYSNKKQVSRALMYAIQQCDQEYLGKWKQFTNEVLLNSNTFQIGIILLSAFCCSEINGNILEQLDSRIFPFSMDILTAELQNFAQHNAIKVLQIYQVWKMIAEYLMNCQTEIATKAFSKWAKNQKFVQNLRFTYTQMSTGKGAHYLYLNQQILYQQVNDIKKVALQLHLNILQHLLHKYSKVKSTLLYQFTGLEIELFVNTLCYVNFNENFMERYNQEEIVITMLKIIRVLCSQCPGIIYKSWKSMLHYVIFPFLAIGEEELADFEENTSSFIEITQDCCEKQKMGILKTQAAKFMEKIADSSQSIQLVASKIEGPNYQPVKLINGQTLITKYIINFAISSIKHHLQMQFFDKKQFFQETCSQVLQSVKILSVETAFLILSIFSYCIDSYKKQVESIRVILCSDRSVNLPPIERTRIYAFLAYNYEQVFGLIHIKTLKFWVNLALQEINQPTVQYCALDFVTNTLNNYYDENQIKSIIKKISTNNSPNFWAMIKKIVLQHLIKFSQSLLMDLVHESFKRIQIQLNNLHSQKIKMTHIITVLLQVLKIISEKGDFIQQKRELRKLLWESTKLYKISISHYFEKEVVNIINCFLFYATKQEIQHIEMSKFIPEFIMDFIRNDYVPTHYYIAFNHFIMKGDFQSSVMSIYTVLKQSLNFFIGTLSNQVNRRKIPIAHTMLLLQNIITLHGQKIPMEQLNFIRQIVKNVFPKKIEIKRNQKIKKKLAIYDRTILSRALNLQLICHIFNPLQSTITTILKYVQLNLFYGYDVSVILSCLYLLIKKQTRINFLVQQLQLVITVIYKFIEMEIQSKIQKINQQQRKEKKQLQFDDSDGGKIDQQHNQERQNKKNAMLIRIQKINDYQSILAFIDTPFLKDEKKYINYSRGVKSVKDVREQFIKELKKLYQANQALIQSILGSYSQEIKYRIQVITQIKMNQILSGSLSKGVEQQKTQRKKYTVRKAKQGYIQDTITSQVYNFTEQQLTRREIHKLISQNNQSQDEKQLLKRQRAQKKRKQKQNHQ